MVFGGIHWKCFLEEISHWKRSLKELSKEGVHRQYLEMVFGGDLRIRYFERVSGEDVWRKCLKIISGEGFG